MSLNQTDIDEAVKGKSARFDVTATAASFPPTASTLLIDRYDQPTGGQRSCLPRLQANAATLSFDL
jgi:hypothetical protein